MKKVLEKHFYFDKLHLFLASLVGTCYRWASFKMSTVTKCEFIIEQERLFKMSINQSKSSILRVGNGDSTIH